jgi:hypothetical protein
MVQGFRKQPANPFKGKQRKKAVGPKKGAKAIGPKKAKKVESQKLQKVLLNKMLLAEWHSLYIRVLQTGQA